MIATAQVSQQLQQFFGEKADQVARETQFVQRQSKMTGSKFLQIWVQGFLEHSGASLELLCQVAEDLGVPITKQGMQQRLTPAAVTFLEAMFEHSRVTLRNEIPLALELLTQFTAIEIVDSSSVALPDKLAEEFPGAGGDGPQASLKLQTIWEFLRGNLNAVIRQTGRQPDQRFQGHLAYSVPGALFLQDLGYFALKTLRGIAAGKAYFISRHDSQCALYELATETPFDLLAHLGQTSDDQVELMLLVGQDVKLPCRVLAVRLPTDVVEERRRKAQANACRKGRTLSAEKMAWLAWNVYITNVPTTMLTFQQVILIYVLRWQIELLFRLWKDEAQLDRVAGHLRERVLCELYAKLIGLVIFHYLTAPLRWAERELSPVKALQSFQRHAIHMARAMGSLPDLQAALDTLIHRWQRFALKDKRRSRLSTCKQIELAAARSLG